MQVEKAVAIATASSALPYSCKAMLSYSRLSTVDYVLGGIPGEGSVGDRIFVEDLRVLSVPVLYSYPTWREAGKVVFA